MNISDRQIGEVTVVALSGSIDALTASVMSERMDRLLQDGNVRLVADFDGVDYTSSAGLRVLLATVKEARTRDGDLRLARVQPNVMRVLKLSGFTSILTLHDDVDAAIASFAATAVD